MARIPLGALTTLNLSTHLDPMFTEIYSGAFANFVFSNNNVGLGGAAANYGPNVRIFNINAVSDSGLDLSINGSRVAAVSANTNEMGIGTIGPRSLYIFTNGVEHFRLQSSGTIEVGSSVAGIGSGTRGKILSVSGSAVPGLVVQGAGMNQGVIGFGTGSSTFQIQAGSDYGGMNFVVGGTTVANITTTAVTPNADNTITMGTAAKRWSVVYAGTGTINTSDAREKTKVARLTPAELKAAQEIAREIGAYKFRSAVAEKGDAARIHAGLTVQRAIEIMEDNGLEPFAYAFICHDEWEADGDKPGGDRFGFRMDELMAFVCAGQQAAHDTLEARIKALEAK